MKKLKEAIKDPFTTIPGAIGGIFVVLKLLGLIPASIAEALPETIGEIITGIMSLIMIFKSKKV